LSVPKQAGLLKRFSDQQVARVIDLKDGSRRPSNCRLAKKPRAAPFKMIMPGILARMKEPYYAARGRILARDIGSLVEIAMEAGEGQIVQARLFRTVRPPCFCAMMWSI
jgi:hypothetical protein